MAFGDALLVMVAAWKWRNLRPQWHRTKQLGTHCVPDIDRFHVYVSSICCFSLLANHICQVSLCVSTDGKSHQTVQSKVQCSKFTTVFYLLSVPIISVRSLAMFFYGFYYELSWALTPLLAYLRQHQSQEWISLCMQKGLKKGNNFCFSAWMERKSAMSVCVCHLLLVPSATLSQVQKRRGQRHAAVAGQRQSSGASIVFCCCTVSSSAVSIFAKVAFSVSASAFASLSIVLLHFMHYTEHSTAD